MRKIIPVIIGLALAVGATGEALASPTCTTEPEAKWLSETAMKEKMTGLFQPRIAQSCGAPSPRFPRRTDKYPSSKNRADKN